MGVCALNSRLNYLPRFHPHPRIKYGAGSNPPPSRGGNTLLILLSYAPVHPNPPPFRGGNSTNTPSPLVREGWGEGAQAVRLHYGCYMLDTFTPLPRIKYGAGSSPLPQGERGFDCSNMQRRGSF